jgi:type II secretory pathway component PulF
MLTDEYGVPCAAMNPCPDQSSLNINDFVGDAWWLLLGYFTVGAIVMFVQHRRRIRRRERASNYQTHLNAIKSVTNKKR